MDLTPDQAKAIAELGKLYPAGKRGVMPVDDYWQRPASVSVLAAGSIGGIQPYGLTRRTIRGVKFYEATWENGAPALFIRKADSTKFLDLHSYAVRYRRITGSLPDWASERSPR
jgi:hypothetical protein